MNSKKVDIRFRKQLKDESPALQSAGWPSPLLLVSCYVAKILRRVVSVLGNLAILKIISIKSYIPLLLCEVTTSLRSTSFPGMVAPDFCSFVIEPNSRSLISQTRFLSPQ